MERGKSERVQESLKGEVRVVLLREYVECTMCEVGLEGSLLVVLEVGSFRGYYLCSKCRTDENQLRLLDDLIQRRILD